VQLRVRSRGWRNRHRRRLGLVSSSQPKFSGGTRVRSFSVARNKKSSFSLFFFHCLVWSFFVVSGVFFDAKRNNDCVSVRCGAAAAGAVGKDFTSTTTPFGWSSEARKGGSFFQLGYSTFGVFLGWESNYYFFLLLLITYGCGCGLWWRRFATSSSFQFLSLLSVVLLGSSLRCSYCR
jgi:hypothetical protein